MTNDFLHCYRTLCIAPGATWANIRAAYRTQMREWHPDRFTSDKAQQKLAEERAKAINEAYRQLADFYRTHGAPPLTEPMRATPSRSDAPIRRERKAQAPHWPRDKIVSRTARRRAVRATIMVLPLVAGYIIVDPITLVSREATTPDAVPDPAPDTRDHRAKDTVTYFTVGSTLGEVYATQGIPSHTEGDVWHYGTSKIYFSRGKVTHWDETREHPLRAQLNAPPAPHQGPNYFTRGSTKAEVRRVQGMPLRETDTVWEYGVSRVYFDGDRVVGWSESSLDPLKTH